MKLVINNGYLVDPANRISSKLNIAVEDGKVVQISKDKLSGDKEIDASGLIVSPGFVDIHMHEDRLLEDGFDICIFSAMAKMGVTTCIGGNCGLGPKDIKSYVDAVKKYKLPVNFGMLIPNIALRKHIGLIDKYASPSLEEIQAMEEYAEELLDYGLMGISFGMRYMPGITEDELVGVSKACLKDDKIVAAHIREDGDKVIESIREFFQIGEVLDLKLQLSHIGSMAAYGQMEEALALVDSENANGLRVTMDSYPYNIGASEIGSSTFDKGFLERYKFDYSDLKVIQGKYKGQRLDKILFEKIRDEEPKTFVAFEAQNQEEVDRAITHPNVAVVSDGILNNHQGHPRAGSTFPRFLRMYVREKKLLPLEEAINKMTNLPAEFMNIDKGHLSLGSDGDIVIFDLETIRENGSFEQPLLPPDGIKYVIVNGEIVVEDNELKNVKNGEFIENMD